MAPEQLWIFVVVINAFVIPVSMRRRRNMMKTALPGEIEMLAQTSPVLVVHHAAKQGRGIVVRDIEHIYRCWKNSNFENSMFGVSVTCIRWVSL